MINKKKIVYDYLKNKNDPNYNLSKTAEELNELSLILLQKLNKPNFINDQKIIDEIGDVKIRLNVLEKQFLKSKIKSRINSKINKFYYLIKNKKHKNI